MGFWVGDNMDTRIFSEQMITNMQKRLERSDFKFITYPKFVFLCGAALDAEGYGKSNRGTIDRFIQKQTDDIFIVLSEKLWEDDFNSSIDLLTFEEFLAEISDCIILLVESPGSFCELGAFAYADALFSDKLLVVVDNKYRDSKSFILTGPVAKVKKEGSDVVYAPLDGTGLLSSDELRKAILKRIEVLNSKYSNLNKRKINTNPNCVSISSFIIESLELIKITQPIRQNDLIDLYKKVKGFDSFVFVKRNGAAFHKEIKINYIFKLLQTIGVVKIDNGFITTDYYPKMQNLMLKYYGKSESAERNRLICRKYRYRENI